jgi:hypothetical protein
MVVSLRYSSLTLELEHLINERVRISIAFYSVQLSSVQIALHTFLYPLTVCVYVCVLACSQNSILISYYKPIIAH